MINSSKVAATILCCGLVAGPSVADENAVDGLAQPVWLGEDLKRELHLSEEQIEQLAEINHAREDELFPLVVKMIEKQWDLRREYRVPRPNDALLTMIERDLEQIHGDVQRINARHRAAARAILSAEQTAALARLEDLIDSMQAVTDAMRINLIGDPGGVPMDLLPFGVFGSGVFGIR